MFIKILFLQVVVCIEEFVSSNYSTNVVTGSVTYAETGKPVTGVIVEIIDDDLFIDDPIASGITDESGDYRIEYNLEDFQDIAEKHLDRVIEGRPDIYVEVRTEDGSLLKTTKDAPIREVDREATIDVTIPGHGPEDTTRDDSSSTLPTDEPSIFDPATEIEYLDESRVIKLVKLSTPNVTVGTPVSVTVVLDPEEIGEDTVPSINGVPGSTHTLQFSEPGEKRIHVAAFTLHEGQQKTIDHRSITVDVDDQAVADTGEAFQPIIETQQVPGEGLSVEFSVSNADDYPEDDGVYVWDINDEQQVVTETPRLQHDFSESLEADSPFTTDTVSVQVQSDSVTGANLGKRSVGNWNQDHLNQLQGVIELTMVGTPEVVREGDNFVLSYELENPGSVEVDIESRQLEYLTVNDDESSPAFLMIAWPEPSPLREPEPVSFSIPAGDSVTREFEVPVSDAPPDMFGIGLHFYGTATVSNTASYGPSIRVSELEVFGNVYAERRYNHPLAIPIEDPDLLDMLDNVDAVLPDGLLNTPVSIPDLIGDTSVLPDGCPPPGKPRVRKSLDAVDKHAVLEKLPKVSSHREDQVVDSTRKPVSDGGIAAEIPDSENASEGDMCLPFQDPPEEGMACQLTDEFEKVYIPGRILNARKGDVILSPGSGSAIAELLKQVDPMEIYSHSGIMTEDHLEIRHSTASSKWLGNQTAGSFLGNEGTEGLDPIALKYAWPGTITQSVEDAYEGGSMEGPDGENYEVSGFTSEISSTQATGNVWPEVVKPDPRREYEISNLRDTLNEVADKALGIDGHYRFYAYTDAAEAFTLATTDDWMDEPYDKDAWWDETYGTVCSSLIWGAVRQLEDPPNLEMEDQPLTSADLESDDDGATVVDDTEDGLYYYYADERKNAAQWLYDHFYGIAEEESGFLGKVLTDAPDDVANQITNTFASDWSGVNDAGDHSKDSDKWQSPGGGNAVSPDTIRNYWDAPSIEDGELQGLYGHHERLVYRPGRIEERRVHRWKRVEPEDATLDVTVTYDGDTVDYATVDVGGETTQTDQSGEASVERDPGEYYVHAQKMVDGWHLSKKKVVNLDPGAAESVTLDLERPDEMFRLIGASGTMKLLDDDWGNNPTQKKPLTPKLVQMGPQRDEKSLHWSQTVDGEVTGKIHMDLEWQPNADVSIDIEMELYQNGNEELDYSLSGTIPRDGWYEFWGELKSGGIDNPHAWFDGTVENDPSPT